MSEIPGTTWLSPEFKKWYRKSEVTIENIFGKTTRHLNDFYQIQFKPDDPADYYSDWEASCLLGKNNMSVLLDSFIDEINEWGIEHPIKKRFIENDALENIKRIIMNFHTVSRQLRSRYSGRDTLSIKDEYDVQDLFHAMLLLFFDDVRAEEYCPSYAGANSRLDFLIKKERIVVEIKKTRDGMSSKSVGEELIIDSLRYKEHPDCLHLICFVYDPEGYLANPRGIESDLSKEIDELLVSVFIAP